MPRTRRTSNVIAKAIVRSNNLKAISPTLDLGGGLTVEEFDKLIARTEAAQDDYNQTVAALDEKGNKLPVGAEGETTPGSTAARGSLRVTVLGPQSWIGVENG